MDLPIGWVLPIITPSCSASARVGKDWGASHIMHWANVCGHGVFERHKSCIKHLSIVSICVYTDV